VTTAANAHKELDIFAGSGWAWSSWDNTNPIKFPRKESNNDGLISMRGNFLGGLRLAWVGDGIWQILYGVELNYFYSTPSVQGTWKYVQRDANENIVDESRQPNTSETVPLVNSVQASGMIGLRRQLLPTLAIEGSLHVGLGAGTAQYAVNYPDASGGLASFTGPAAQLMARIGAKIFLSQSLAIGCEVRSIFESISDNWLPITGLRDRQRLVNIYSHLFLVSITYRFGE